MTKSNSKKSKPTSQRITQQIISPLDDHLHSDDNQNSKEIDLGDISDIFEPEKISNFKSTKTRHKSYDSTFDTKDYQSSEYSQFDEVICSLSSEVNNRKNIFMNNNLNNNPKRF